MDLGTVSSLDGQVLPTDGILQDSGGTEDAKVAAELAASKEPLSASLETAVQGSAPSAASYSVKVPQMASLGAQAFPQVAPHEVMRHATQAAGTPQQPVAMQMVGPHAGGFSATGMFPNTSVVHFVSHHAATPYFPTMTTEAVGSPQRPNAAAGTEVSLQGQVGSTPPSPHPSTDASPAASAVSSSSSAAVTGAPNGTQEGLSHDRVAEGEHGSGQQMSSNPLAQQSALTQQPTILQPHQGAAAFSYQHHVQPVHHNGHEANRHNLGYLLSHHHHHHPVHQVHHVHHAHPMHMAQGTGTVFPQFQQQAQVVAQGQAQQQATHSQQQPNGTSNDPSIEQQQASSPTPRASTTLSSVEGSEGKAREEASLQQHGMASFTSQQTPQAHFTADQLHHHHNAIAAAQSLPPLYALYNVPSATFQPQHHQASFSHQPPQFSPHPQHQPLPTGVRSNLLTAALTAVGGAQQPQDLTSASTTGVVPFGLSFYSQQPQQAARNQGVFHGHLLDPLMSQSAGNSVDAAGGGRMTNDVTGGVEVTGVGTSSSSVASPFRSSWVPESSGDNVAGGVDGNMMASSSEVSGVFGSLVGIEKTADVKDMMSFGVPPVHNESNSLLSTADAKAGDLRVGGFYQQALHVASPMGFQRHVASLYQNQTGDLPSQLIMPPHTQARIGSSAGQLLDSTPSTSSSSQPHGEYIKRFLAFNSQGKTTQAEFDGHPRTASSLATSPTHRGAFGLMQQQGSQLGVYGFQQEDHSFQHYPAYPSARGRGDEDCSATQKSIDVRKRLTRLQNHVEEGAASVDSLSSGSKRGVAVTGGDETQRGSRIFVTRLPWTATAEDLKKHFEVYGEIMDAYCPKNPHKPRQNKGFGFVSFRHAESADKAMMNKEPVILERRVVVDRASGRNERKPIVPVAKVKSKMVSSNAGDGFFSKDLPNAEDFAAGFFATQLPTNGLQRSLQTEVERLRQGLGERSHSGGFSDYLQAISSSGHGLLPFPSQDSASLSQPHRLNGQRAFQESASFDAAMMSQSSTSGFSSVRGDVQSRPFDGVGCGRRPPGGVEWNRRGHKLFVGRLGQDTTVEALREYFQKYGEVIDVYIPKDPTAVRIRGFGFVTFLDPASVHEVLAASRGEGHVVCGRKVVVDMADASSRKFLNVNPSTSGSEEASPPMDGTEGLL